MIVSMVTYHGSIRTVWRNVKVAKESRTRKEGYHYHGLKRGVHFSFQDPPIKLREKPLENTK